MYCSANQKPKIERLLMQLKWLIYEMIEWEDPTLVVWNFWAAKDRESKNNFSEKVRGLWSALDSCLSSFISSAQFYNQLLLSFSSNFNRWMLELAGGLHYLFLSRGHKASNEGFIVSLN